MNSGPGTSLSTLKTGGSSKGRTIHREHGHNSTGSDRPRRVECDDGSAMDVDLTDDEDHEAITPPSTWGKGDLRWTPAGEGTMSNLPKGVDDVDMFKAAIALCGLGRRT